MSLAMSSMLSVIVYPFFRTAKHAKSAKILIDFLRGLSGLCGSFFVRFSQIRININTSLG